MGQEALGQQQDRRINSRLRETLGPALLMLEPLVGPMSRGEVSSYALEHILHDHFPELSGLEVQVMLDVLTRYRREGRLAALIAEAHNREA